jgi:TonB-dependent SusC/RagA subfamily outer membrane receptor
MNGILYLLQVNLYLIAFYAFYRLLLSKETFFGLNRSFLIASTLMSFGIPILQSDWLKEWLAPQKVQEVAQQLNYQTYEFITATPTAEIISMADILSWIYFTVVVILLIRLIYRLIKAYRWVKNPQNNLQACSFFNYIAVDEDLEGREAIMVHEQIHVQQGHSADVLFFELNTIVNWFNPVAYLYKKEIRKVHEYTADAAASETLNEKSAYAMLLFHENFGLKAQDLTNSFFNQSILKQRIMMLQKSKSKRSALLKYGFTAPLFLGMLVVSSAFVSEKSTQQVVESVLTDTIPNPAIPPSAPKPEAPKKAPKTGIKADDNLIYIVNGKELSAAEVRKIDKNKIVTIEIKGPEKDRKKSVMVMNLKPANANGDSSVIKRNDTKGIGTNKPLIVIDGKVMEAGFDMNSIKPNDIASISILKDKSATAVYGEKGKNGVMEITLKKKN